MLNTTGSVVQCLIYITAERKPGQYTHTHLSRQCLHMLFHTHPPVRPWNRHSVITAISGDDGVLMSILASATSLGSQLADNYDRPRYYHNDSSIPDTETLTPRRLAVIGRLTSAGCSYALFFFVCERAAKLKLVSKG